MFRGITEDTIHEFELGFGEGGESLTLHLMKNGFSVQDIARSGLSNKNTSGMFRDKFIRRIMFPISNNVGKTVAFTGRIMPGEEKYNGTELPKYLNSPETPIFQKSKILYGFDKAKKPILDARAVVLVEGQMDFLMTWQTGVKNVVAVSGTGLTREHLDRLRKSADTIFMALDNDKAGIQALERNIETLGAFDFHARAIHLGEHKDPGDACLKDPEFMKRGIEEAKPAMEYVFDAHLKNGFTDMAEKKREVRFLISKIAAIRSGIERDTWMKELAIRSGIGEAALMEELIEIEREKIQKKDEREIPGNPVHIEKDGLLLMVEQLIFCSAQDEKLQKKLLDEINFIPEPYKSAVETKSGDLWNELEMRAAIELSLKGRDEIEQEFSDLLKKLKQHALKIRQTDLRKKLQFAEESGDEQEQQKILQQINELAKILHTL
jgi:DNA primase